MAGSHQCSLGEQPALRVTNAACRIYGQLDAAERRPDPPLAAAVGAHARAATKGVDFRLFDAAAAIGTAHGELGRQVSACEDGQLAGWNRHAATAWPAGGREADPAAFCADATSSEHIVHVAGCCLNSRPRHASVQCHAGRPGAVYYRSSG